MSLSAAKDNKDETYENINKPTYLRKFSLSNPPRKETESQRWRRLMKRFRD